MIASRLAFVSNDAGVRSALTAFDDYVRAEVLADRLLLDDAGAGDWDLRKSLKVVGARPLMWPSNE